MALLWIDGFDSYGDSVGSAPLPTGVVGLKYTAAVPTIMKVRDGRLGGHSLSIIYGLYTDLGVVKSPDWTNSDTVVIGVAIKFNSLPGVGPVNFISLYDDTTLGVNLQMNTSGQLYIYRGGSSLAGPISVGIVTGAWYYFELKVKCATSGGTYETRINGNTIAGLTSASANTKQGTHSYHDGFYISGMGISGSVENYFDDLYFLDATGSVNNDFLGNMRVSTLRPNASGDITQFTPDSGSNYARVNESQYDTTSYVQTTVSTNEDLYNYDDLSVIATNIKGIQISTVAELTDANSYSLYTHCKSNGTDNSDTGQGLTANSYTLKTRMLEGDPGNANAAWTQTTVNAAQFGIEAV